MRKINQIIIHCSYTRPSQGVSIEDIKRWHVQENGWREIGYHYVIERDSSIARGRQESEIGAHARGSNDDSLGVCLVGGMSEDGSPEFNYTQGQMMALNSLIHAIKSDHGKGVLISGHNEHDNNKSCPCFNVNSYFRYEA
tara:strand:+ start:1452 stop:1871 length:420 start_codon:yes stop_codon:yes gene_type:complete